MTNSFALLWRELRNRFGRHLLDATYWFYISLSVVVFGGVGVWVELIDLFSLHLGRSDSSCGFVDTILSQPRNLAIAMVGYFPAIAGASLCHEIIGTEDKKKYYRSFALFILVIIGILAIVSSILIRHDYIGYSLVLSIFSILLAILMCWIAYSPLTSVSDDTNPDAAAGGDDSLALPGSTDGYKT